MDGRLSELKSVVSVGRVVDDPQDLVAYETPERGERGTAAFLVEPGTSRELAAVAAWAYANHQRLVIQGANSGLVEGSTPDRSGEQAVLGLGRLDKLLDFDPADRVAIVEAGVRLDELNNALSEANQLFPIELGSNPTIGGLLATNAGGARTVRHGDAGSRLLGLEAVIADEKGSTLGEARALLKDNSRLRLDRLFVGSYGALGVITKLAVRTADMPRSVASAFVRPSSHHQVPEVFTAFERDFEHQVAAFEFISGETIALATSTTPGLRSPFGHASRDIILVEVASGSVDQPTLEEGLASQLERISTRTEWADLDAVVVPPAEAWALRHALSEGVMRSGDTIRFDVSVPRRRLPELRDFVIRRFSSPSVVVSEFGHWGDGGTHLSLVYPNRDIPESTEQIRSEIYDEVVLRLGGSFSSEHGLGRHNASFYEKYIPEPERLMAQQLKLLLDPHMVWGSAPFAAPFI